MEKFRPIYNPLAALLRLPLIAFSFGIGCISLYVLITDFSSLTSELIISFCGGGVVFCAFAALLLPDFLNDSKVYTFDEQGIYKFNLLTFSTEFIPKSAIKGFSTSVLPLNIWDFKQVILYLNDGIKLEINQSCYLNYRKIKPALIEKGYHYLGHEPYEWNWRGINARFYKFDKTEKSAH